MYPLSHHLFQNPLSTAWRDLSTSKIVLPLYYIGGMIGYSCSLITRTLGVGKDAIFLVGSFFYSLKSLDPQHIGREVKLRVIVLLGSLGEVCIAIIGVICPPLAYSLDEHLYSHREIAQNAWLSMDHGISHNQIKDEVTFRNAYHFLNSHQLIENNGHQLKFFVAYAIIKKLEYRSYVDGFQFRLFDFQRWNDVDDNDWRGYEEIFQSSDKLEVARHLKLAIETDDDAIPNIDFYRLVKGIAIKLVNDYNSNIYNLLTQTEARLII